MYDKNKPQLKYEINGTFWYTAHRGWVETVDEEGNVKEIDVLDYLKSKVPENKGVRIIVEVVS